MSFIRGGWGALKALLLMGASAFSFDFPPKDYCHYIMVVQDLLVILL